MSKIVVEYLRDNPVESLQQFGIYARRSTVNPAKFSLNYDQIEAVDGHPLVDACRGLVLRDPDAPGGGYRVLARPFVRFYNLGSPHAAPLDWSTAVFETKLDGTLCIVYHDPDLGRWCVATRNVPDADVPSHTGETFADLFWRHEAGIVSLSCRPGVTYLFELTGPGNQIVIAYDHWTTTLLAAFDTETGEELPRPFSIAPPTADFLDLDAAQAWLAEQPGHLTEGFVVRDAAGRRVKVKSRQYAVIAKTIGTAGTDAGLLAIVLDGRADDIRGFLPAERAATLDRLAAGVRAFAVAIEREAADLPKTDRKTAALAVKDGPFSAWIGTILDLWTGRFATFAEWLDAERAKQGGAINSSTMERVMRFIGGAQ